MTEPYVGEIRLFAGNFAPDQWHFCDGSLLSINDYDTLFALIGTTYGGDGQSNFGLPDLRGRVPVHQGTLGSDVYQMGQSDGTENVTITTPQLPVHNHPLMAAGVPGDTSVPQSGQALSSEGPANVSAVTTYAPYSSSNAQVTLVGTSIGSTGGNQPHGNIQPTMAVNYIISLFGIYPSPS